MLYFFMQDLEKGFPTDFSNSEFSSTKQNSMLSVQTNRLEEDTTMKQGKCLFVGKFLV